MKSRHAAAAFAVRKQSISKSERREARLDRVHENLDRVAREVGMPPEVVADIERQIDEYIADYKAAFHAFHAAKLAPRKRRERRGNVGRQRST